MRHVGVTAGTGQLDLSACDVDEAVETLSYWRSRRERVPWFRRAARQECDQMIANWQHRLWQAVLRERNLSRSERLGAALFVVRTRASIAGRNWKRRAGVGAVALAGSAGAGFAWLIGVV
jgi:hypothetical protein